jgi:hypothetical protein
LSQKSVKVAIIATEKLGSSFSFRLASIKERPHRGMSGARRSAIKITAGPSKEKTRVIISAKAKELIAIKAAESKRVKGRAERLSEKRSNLAPEVKEFLILSIFLTAFPLFRASNTAARWLNGGKAAKARTKRPSPELGGALKPITFKRAKEQRLELTAREPLGKRAPPKGERERKISSAQSPKVKPS